MSDSDPLLRRRALGRSRAIVWAGYSGHPGIFAAGDAIVYTGKVNLLVGTFQDAVNAVNSVKQYLNPTAEKHAMVSSHNEAFVEKNKQYSL